MANIKFLLNGCDISFIAEAPEDITLKELLAQTDKLKPDWCACGIRSLGPKDYEKTEVFITKNSIRLAMIVLARPLWIMEIGLNDI